MKQLVKLALFAMVFMMIATSCQQKGNDGFNAVEDDEMIVQELATGDDEEILFDASIDDGSEDNIVNNLGTPGSSLGKVSAPIDTVLNFGRRFDPHPRRIVKDIRRIGSDSIFVSLTRLFRGVFVIVEKGQDTTGTRPIIIHRKRMSHVVKRNAIYVKRDTDRDSDAITDRPHRGWKLASVSMGAGHSVPEPSIRFNELTITSSGGVNISITSPLDTFFDTRDDLPTFVPGEEVTVQIKLTNSTLNPVDPFGTGATETLLLHHGVNRKHHGRKFFDYVGTDPATGDQIYQGTWTVEQAPGHVYHAVVDAIDNGTIYDNNASAFPYNSTTWGTPYRVVESK